MCNGNDLWEIGIEFFPGQWWKCRGSAGRGNDQMKMGMFSLGMPVIFVIGISYRIIWPKQSCNRVRKIKVPSVGLREHSGK